MSNVTKKIYRFGDMSGVFATVNGVTEFLLIPYGYEARVNEEKLAGKYFLLFRFVFRSA